MPTDGWRDDGIARVDANSWVIDGRISIEDADIFPPRAWAEHSGRLATFHTTEHEPIAVRVVLWDLSAVTAGGLRVARKIGTDRDGRSYARRWLPPERWPRLSQSDPSRVPAAVQRGFEAGQQAAHDSLVLGGLQEQLDVQRNPWRQRDPFMDDALMQQAMGYVLELDEGSERATSELAALRAEVSKMDRAVLEERLLFRLLESAREGLDSDN